MEEGGHTAYRLTDPIIDSLLAGPSMSTVRLVPMLRDIAVPFCGPAPTGGSKWGDQGTLVLYVVLMAALIVAVDVLFFKSRFWERLMVNAGIVLVFGAFYVRFFQRP